MIAILLALSSGAAFAEAPLAPTAKNAQAYFTDVELVDQNGRTHRLYTDLMKGKTVVIHSFFASCTGSCPVSNGTLREVQRDLGSRVGADVNLLSITIDPVTDTPARLHTYAETMNAQAGWYFLTGTVDNVRLATSRLGQWVEDRETHMTIFLIGNDRTGLWKKALSLGPPAEIVQIVRSVVDDKGP